MPEYQYECHDCGTKRSYTYSMEEDKPDSHICRACGKTSWRIFGARVDTFSPYTDHHIATSPVTFETREQRDTYLREHNLTYDKTRYSTIVEKPSETPITDSLTNEALHDLYTNDRATLDVLTREEKELEALDDAGEIDERRIDADGSDPDSRS